MPIFLYNHSEASVKFIDFGLEWSAKDLEMLQANIAF